MAKPSPAALDVMEHITDAIDTLDRVLDTIDGSDTPDLQRAVLHAREELQEARLGGAEVLLEILNLSEQRELMQGEIQQIRSTTH